jgi:hypothetical protein
MHLGQAEGMSVQTSKACTHINNRSLKNAEHTECVPIPANNRARHHIPILQMSTSVFQSHTRRPSCSFSTLLPRTRHYLSHLWNCLQGTHSKIKDVTCGFVTFLTFPLWMRLGKNKSHRLEGEK